MASTKFTSLLLATFVVAFLYQAPCSAKLDEPTKVVTVDHPLQDPSSKAPKGYEYLTMIKDPNGLYNYIYYLYRPVMIHRLAPAPAGQFIAQLTFDHKLAEPQQHAPYDQFNYLYFYPDKGSFVYVFAATPPAKLINDFRRLMSTIHQHALLIDEAIERIKANRDKGYGFADAFFTIMLQALEDMKQYYGATSDVQAYHKLREFAGMQPDLGRIFP